MRNVVERFSLKNLKNQASVPKGKSSIALFVALAAVLSISETSFAFESKLKLCRPIENCEVKFIAQEGNYGLFAVKAPEPQFEGGPGLEFAVGELVDLRTDKSVFIFNRQPDYAGCEDIGTGIGGHGSSVGPCVPGGTDVFGGGFIKSPSGQILFNFAPSGSYFDLCFNEYTALNFDRKKATEPLVSYPAKYDPLPVISQTTDSFTFKSVGNSVLRTIKVGETILKIDTLRYIPIYVGGPYREGISGEQLPVKRVKTTKGYRYYLVRGTQPIKEYFLRLDGIFDENPVKQCSN